MELPPQLGQPLIIENRRTASGIIAAEACANAMPGLLYGCASCIATATVTTADAGATGPTA